MSGWRLDWRGSSGSLWNRSRDHSGTDHLDLLNGAHHVSTSNVLGREGSRKERKERKGLRKRFLSLTEGLANLLSSEKKDQESTKPTNFEPFDHSDLEGDVVTSGYWSDHTPKTHRRQGSSTSLASYREKSLGPSWTSPVLGQLKKRKVDNVSTRKEVNKSRQSPVGPMKAPPSPPPRRFSLWAMDVHYEHYMYTEPRPTPNTTLPDKPPPPPPPVRYFNLKSSMASQPGHQASPQLQTQLSLSSLESQGRPHTPKTPSTHSTKSNTPFTSRSTTPLRSPVKRGRSLTDSRVDMLRAVSESQGKESRADWYRRKSQARRRAHCPVQGSGSVEVRTVGVVLEKEEGSFGFTVRGGSSLDPAKSRPLIITHVRPGGPADREGSIKAGDRLVGVDGRDLTHSTLTEAQEALRRVERGATLTIEYDVSVMEGVRGSGGPLLVEIERAAGTSLGITLTHAHPTDPSGAIVIETIRTASIAERCGALAVNDIVAAIDGTRLDQLTVAEAAQLLKTAPGSHVTLEVIPTSLTHTALTFRRGGGMAFPHLYGVAGGSNGYGSSGGGSGGVSGGGGGGGGGYMSAGSSYNTLSSQRPHSSAARRVNRRNRPTDRAETGSISSHTTVGNSSLVGGVAVSHAECLTVTLVVEGRGYGLVLRPSPHPIDPDTALPVIAAIDQGGPADKSSVVCVGDRLVGVNGRSVSGLGVSEVTQMIANSRPTVTLDVEFDVADSVVPSSGTFAVKLAKRHNGLGITLTASRRSGGGEPLLISEVVRGSPAHRSGTMQPGDKLLAIDSTRLDHLNLDDARTCLQSCHNIVTLRVQKDDLYSEESGVVYTVELVRHGGALGITISGSEEPFDPIYIAGLAPGGLADRTGAIHIGDRLLGINGSSLRGRPLSEAILMLQNSGDTVTLKISRPRDSGVASEELSREDWLGRYGPALPSVDSAVESWDSSGLDPLPPGSTPALSKRDSGSDIVFRSDCGSTVRRRLGAEGREESNTLIPEATDSRKPPEGHAQETWQSPSPPPSIDSGQSEDKTDWDKMIADLNHISESCGLRERANSPDTLTTPGQPGAVNKKEVHVNGGEVNIGGGGDSDCCQTLTPRGRCPGGGGGGGGGGSEAREEGSYSVSNAAVNYTAAAYTRTASPPPGGGQVYQVTLHKDRVYEDFGFSVSDGLYEKGVYVNRIRKGGPADRSGVLKPFDRILQVNETRTHDFDCCLTVPLMAAAGDRLVLVVSRNPHTHPMLDCSPQPHTPTWHLIQEEEEGEEEGRERVNGEGMELLVMSPPTPSLTPIPTILKTL